MPCGNVYFLKILWINKFKLNLIKNRNKYWLLVKYLGITTIYYGGVLLECGGTIEREWILIFFFYKEWRDKFGWFMGVAERTCSTENGDIFHSKRLKRFHNVFGRRIYKVTNNHHKQQKMMIFFFIMRGGIDFILESSSYMR